MNEEQIPQSDNAEDRETSISLSSETIINLCRECQTEIPDYGERFKSTLLIQNLIKNVFEKTVTNILCESSVNMQEYADVLWKEYMQSLNEHYAYVVHNKNLFQQIKDWIIKIIPEKIKKNSLFFDLFTNNADEAAELKSKICCKREYLESQSKQLKLQMEQVVKKNMTEACEKMKLYLQESLQLEQAMQNKMPSLEDVPDFWEGIQIFLADCHSMENSKDMLELRGCLLAALRKINVHVYDREHIEQVAAMKDNIVEFFLPSEDGEAQIDLPAVYARYKGKTRCLRRGIFEL